MYTETHGPRLFRHADLHKSDIGHICVMSFDTHGAVCLPRLMKS